MATSLKQNYVLNLVNTLAGLIFPLITFPYVSRILLADGIGLINFYYSVISYIALFSTLGIPLYAVREIATVKDNRQMYSKITIEILLLHTILTLAGYIVVFILATTVDKIQINVQLFWLLSLNLIFGAIGVNWFYQGLEDFKYITIRSLIVKICSVVALFIFVKERSDLLCYAFLNVMVDVGSNAFNFVRLRKFIVIQSVNLQEIHPWRHLKPTLKIFILNLIISLYVNTDSVMLGFLKNEAAVGYYTAATRITRMLTGIATALGAVLLPRLSNLVASYKMVEFKQLADKAIGLMIALALPMSIGLAFMASPLIKLFCGNGYIPSILTVQLLSPIILFISLSGVVGMQILYSLGKENKVIIAVTTGAISNFCLNLWLIPQYAQYGASFSSAIAEFCVTTTMIVMAWKYTPIHFFDKNNRTYVIATSVMAIFLWFTQQVCKNEYQFMMIGVPCSIVIYISFLYVCKDRFVLQIKDMIINRISSLKHKNN